MNILIRDVGLVDYIACWQAMQDFTNGRTRDTADELWLVQHPPVFTLGRAGKREHLLAPRDIPVVDSDRGGQVTYHGPGQLVVYVLLDVRRQNLGPRELVRRIEQGVIDYLAALGINAERRAGAPGVYVDNAKVAALGLRIRKGCSYHGVALNVRMDLEPYQRINPCGYAGLKATDLNNLGATVDFEQVKRDFLPMLCRSLYAAIAVQADYTDTLPIAATFHTTVEASG